MRLLCIALLLISHTSFGQDSVKVSGNIQHPLTDSLVMSYNSSPIAYYPQEFITRIDKKGNFSTAFPVPKGVYTEITIRHGKRLASLIMRGKDNLVMSADAQHFDSTVHYTGRGSEIQNFIARHVLDRGTMGAYPIKIKEAIYKDPTDFLKIAAKEKKAELEYIDKNKKGLPVAFIKYWNAYYSYYNYFFMQQYPQIHELLKLGRLTDTIPEANYEVAKEMAYTFDDSLIDVMPYLLYLTGVFDTKLKVDGYRYFRKDTAIMRKAEDSVNTLAFAQMPDKSGEYFIAQNIYGRAKHQPIERTEYQFGEFKKRWPRSEYMPLVTQQVSITERLAPGQPAPDIDIHTTDGRSMKLSDLKGKVVYLNFWAGWCKQCVGEIISEQKIKSLTRKEPLEFVYVSIDNDSAADNNIIKKYKIEGLFTHATGEWRSKEVQQYGVQSLPAYFLIDKEGNFAVQNALTPMQPTALILQIEKLLK